MSLSSNSQFKVYGARRADVADARLHTAIIGLAIAAVFLLSAIAQTLLHTYFSIAYPALTENDWYSWAISLLPMYLLGMPIAYLLLRTIPANAPQKQSLHPLMWFGFFALCFCLSLVANLIGQMVSLWFAERIGADVEIQNELANQTVSVSFASNLLFVGILGPIFEELFYRKAIIDRLQRYGDLPAILLSGMAFGLIHGNFNQLFYTTVVGMLLGYIYLRTGSVLYTISIHIAYNLIGGVFSTELMRRVGENGLPAIDDLTGWLMLLAYLLFYVSSIIISVIFVGISGRHFNGSLQTGECSLSFWQWLRAVILNPGIWIFLFVVLLLFL